MIKPWWITLFWRSILPILCGYWVGCNYQASGPLTLSNYKVLSFILLIQNDVRNLALQMASVEKRMAYGNVLKTCRKTKGIFQWYCFI